MVFPERASSVAPLMSLERFGDCKLGLGLRYFSVLQVPETALGQHESPDWPPGRVILLARAQGRASSFRKPRKDETYHSTVLLLASLSSSVNGLDRTSLQLWNSSVVYNAPHVSHNLAAALVPGADGRLQLVAVGGQFLSPERARWLKLYAGIHLLRAQRLSDVSSNAWSTAWDRRRTYRETLLHEPPLILNGFHPGCVECRRGTYGACEFDGKLSVVKFRGRVLIYARANLEAEGGGRYVQFTASEGDDPLGPYRPLRLIDIAGYAPWSGGNIYYATVNPNPLDHGNTLLGLFPVALNETDVRPALKRSRAPLGFMGLSISCDGHHWAPLTVLSHCKVQHNRTLCQPADGLVTVDGQIFAFVHDDVPQICTRGWPALVPHKLDLDFLGNLTAAARRTLPGCE